MRSMFALIALSLLLIACTENTPDIPGINPTPGIREINTTGISPESTESVVDGNNEFAIELYKEIGDQENVFFSPYSISTALAMTYEGARGRTADEMAQVMRFPADAAVRRPGFAALHAALQGKQEGYEISTANALWAQEGYALLPGYVADVAQYYGGAVRRMDFMADPDGSRETINTWVEEQTRDRIKDLIKPGMIDAGTRLVLTNAIYFKGTWVYEFDEDKTREADFRVSSTKTVRTEMMRQTNEEARYGYTEDDAVQVLSMPYKGNRTSMLFILPKDVDGLAAVEGSLTAAQVESWRSSLGKRQIPTVIPKFTFTQETLLADTLSAMGMPSAFGDADFSGMTGNRDFVIDSIIHKAFIKVDEEGTEAAAATAVIMRATSAGPMESFVADHPFIFMIVDDRTGAILFMGKITDPSIL